MTGPATPVRDLTMSVAAALHEGFKTGGVTFSVFLPDSVLSGKLAVDPRDPEKCTRTQCDGYDLCRVPRARWLAKAARVRQLEDPA